MTTWTPPQDLSGLRGKAVIITGCATGIGRETAKLAFEHGANLVLADWNEEGVRQLVEELKTFDATDRLHFHKTDVSKWDDIVDIFELAKQKFGVIHAVISNAGINSENLLEQVVDDKTNRLAAPDLKSIEVNLIAHIYIAKCALHYFSLWPAERCQIVLTASAASFLETPPLYQYCAAKAGVVGLLRAMRTKVVESNVTINAIAPWMTVTPMLPQAIVELWGDLPANSGAGVGRALLTPVLRQEVNGKCFFIAGNQMIEVEDQLDACRASWLGEKLAEHVNEGQRRLLVGGIKPEN